jgi:hypothetical protein
MRMIHAIFTKMGCRDAKYCVSTVVDKICPPAILADWFEYIRQFSNTILDYE